MPKSKLFTTHGLGFEDTVRRLIATPPMPKRQKAKQTPKKAKRAKG